MSTSDVVPRRRPGRPPRKTAPVPAERVGVAAEAQNTNNVIEFVYGKPTNFKKLCAYWKSLNSERIRFEFGERALVMRTQNYKDTNEVVVTCHGEHITRYHCAERCAIDVVLANLEPVLSKIDGIYQSIEFIVQRRTMHKTLHVVLQNDANIPEYFEIDMVIDSGAGSTVASSPTANMQPYELEFTLPGRYFKKMVSDTRQLDNQWTIEKVGHEPLSFRYRSTNAQVRVRCMPRNASDINLVSRIRSDEIFSVSVFVDALRPTSSSQLADSISVRTSRDRPLHIRAMLDEPAISVEVLIKIVDNRA